MIYTELTCKAMKLAYEAHHGQLDKGGIPYIFHPIHLAEQMTDEYTTCVALLHDTVEDTHVTLEQLAAIFPAPVVEAVALMTHSKDTDYETYVTAIRDNPIARSVKLADLAHNMDASRLPDTPENAAARAHRNEKYSKALQILK